MQPWFQEALKPLCASLPLFKSRDLQEVKRQTTTVLSDHVLNWRSGIVDASLFGLQISRGSIMRMRYGAAVNVTSPALAHFFLFQVPLHGVVSIAIGGTRITTDSRTAALISPTMPVELDWGEGSEQLLVKLPREQVERVCGRLLGMQISSPIEFRPQFVMDAMDGCCWQHQLSALLSAPTESTRECLKKWVDAQEEALIEYLLLRHPHNYSDLLAQRVKGSPRNMRRALEYIDHHLREPLVLARIAESGGMSVRSLCAMFGDCFGQSPMAYVRARRLEHVHADLVSAPPHTRVTDVALRWGFAHLGRLCARYRDRYGETPAQTLRR